MVTNIKISSLIILVLIIFSCQNSEQKPIQLIEKKLGLFENENDSIGVELKLNEFKNWKELLERTERIACSDSLPKFTLKSAKNSKTVYFRNPCWENFGSILIKQKNIIQIHNDTISLLKSALKQEETNYKKRFVIKKSKGIQLLNVSDISLIEASGDFCMAIDASGKKHPISQNLGSIQQTLNPLKFFRINRSQIAHIEYIENIESHFKNRLLIQLTGIKEKVMTSSSTTSDFRKWLEQ